MLMVALLLAQATAPTAVEPAEEAAPAAVQTPVSAEDAPDEPKMKRVCKKVMDPRVGTLGSRTLKCKYVPADQPDTGAL